MLKHRLLYQSTLVTIHEVECTGERGRGREEESSACNSIALLRRGSFVRRDGFGEHTADLTRVLFFNAGAPYIVDHPEPCGDHCTTLTFGETPLREATGLAGRRGQAEVPFDRGSVRGTPAIHLDHHRLIRAVKADDTLRVEELALSLLAHCNTVDRSRTRTSSAARSAASRLARRAQLLLAAHFREPLTVELLAERLRVSPFHLCRQFRSEIGTSIHDHLTQLRLNQALELLPRYRKRLTELALDLGFASHSHFSQVFRTRFGKAPSEYLVETVEPNQKGVERPL